MHSPPYLTQFRHGFCLSHLTFRLLHKRHERRFLPALLGCLGGAAEAVVDCPSVVDGCFGDVSMLSDMLSGEGGKHPYVDRKEELRTEHEK